MESHAAGATENQVDAALPETRFFNWRHLSQTQTKTKAPPVSQRDLLAGTLSRLGRDEMRDLTHHRDILELAWIDIEAGYIESGIFFGKRAGKARKAGCVRSHWFVKNRMSTGSHDSNSLWWLHPAAAIQGLNQSHERHRSVLLRVVDTRHFASLRGEFHRSGETDQVWARQLR